MGASAKSFGRRTSLEMDGVESAIEVVGLPSRDTVHIVLCVVSVLFGHFVYKKVEGIEKRRWTGTVVGLIISNLVLGVHFWHMVLVTLIVAGLIKTIRKDICHYVIFPLMMIYLTAFRIYTLDNSRAYLHTNLILMLLTCKLGGVAFEIFNSRVDNGKTRKPFPEEDNLPIDPTYGEILHYSFCYIGMLVGPYIRYRTYDDFIKLPFWKYANEERLRTKLISLPFYVIIYLTFESVWPLDYALSDEFKLRSILYKVTYEVIQFQRFKLWMYVGLIISECVCSAAGFGAYPEACESNYTHGPTKGYGKLREISDKDAKSLKYDFNTNSNIDVYTMQTCPWVTVYIREWNKSIQYFMGMYVYKCIPKVDFLKPFRIFITIATCAYWHGIEAGYVIGMSVVPLYVPTDKIYMKIHNGLTGWKSTALAVTMYVVQNVVVGFGIIAFLFIDYDRLIKYYKEVMFLPYLILIPIHLLGLCILKIMYKKKND